MSAWGVLTFQSLIAFQLIFHCCIAAKLGFARTLPTTNNKQAILDEYPELKGLVFIGLILV